jgi:hypothetical protein
MALRAGVVLSGTLRTSAGFFTGLVASAGLRWKRDGSGLMGEVALRAAILDTAGF